MPRDGSFVYTVPGGTDGVPDQPVYSTPYNGFVHDVERDLNAPRPILSGGTSAINARDAMINLNGEICNQIVTNYDSHLFLPGSFYSAPLASGAPTVGAFAGICYAHNVIGDMTLHARSTDDTGAIGGRLYVRQKRAGVWSMWIEQAGAKLDIDAMYVNVSGDVMTGPLIMSGQAEPRNGAIGFGSTGLIYLAYDGSTANAFELSAPLGLPAAPPPLANHAVRKDVMDAADLVIKNALQTNIDLKADKTEVPVAATAAEFRSNSAPSKMLTPGAVWGAAGYQYLAYGQQIDMATGFDFYIPGGPIHNPANPKQGQKGTLWLHTNGYNWGTSWKFPNSVKPVWSGGYDIVSYAVYDANTIWCVHLPAMG